MLGIDIGSRYIKLVALSSYRGRWRLQACISQKLLLTPPQEISRAIVPSLKSALQLLPHGIRRKLPRAGIAVPAAELLFKTIELPSGLAHDQLELALRMEFAQAFAPDDATKLLLDYRWSGERVTAVACRQSLLDRSVAMLTAAGITPALVGVDAMLIADSLSSGLQVSGLNLYIDAGATGVRLHSMRAGIPVYSRSHMLPDDACCDSDPLAYLRLLRRALQQYRLSDMLSKPDALFIYGGAATLAGVQELLQQTFELPVCCVDPFSSCQIRDTDRIAVHGDLHVSAYTLACLLARQDASCV